MARRSSIPSIAAALAVVAGLAGGCAARPTPAVAAAGVDHGHGGGDPVAPALEFLAVAAYAANTLVVPGDATRFGSISGLAFDAVTSQWVGAIDDPVRPRLAWLDIRTGVDRLEMAPLRYTYLRPPPDDTPPSVVDGLDLESLVPLGDGSFAATNEGYIDRRGVAHQPLVLHLARDGAVLGVAAAPPSFAIDPDDRTRGVRHNLGLEALAHLPDGRLVAGLEQPLAQDGPVSSVVRGGRIRLVEFVPEDATWRPGRQWAYDLDPTPRQVGYESPCQDGENGLSELYALDASRLLALERACLSGKPGAPAFNPVRLHLVWLDGADDVAPLPSLEGVEVRPLRKQLLLDLTTLAPQLPLELRTFDNFEGMAAGPAAPDGAPTVLLVSDDNFRATQRLTFLWLKLRGLQ